MDYFNKLLRQASKPAPKISQIDHASEFNKSWNIVKNTLLHPDERQLSKGIKSTEVPARLQSMVDSLVWESSRTEEGMTGACLEYLLKNDVLGTLVRLSEADRPFGIQAEVLRSVQNMVILLDEQFLVHSAVHRAVLRLLRNCVGDDLQEQLDGRNKLVGAAQATVRSQPSEYEEDLVNLLCILCSRIRTYRELLMIFFHDKHWYRSGPLFSVEEDEEEDEDDDTDEDEDITITKPVNRSTSPSPSEKAATSNTSSGKKPEYEFLLFNYLLRFVHREGQTGDFARAGLLFLMDVAMSPGELKHRLTGDDTPKSSSQITSDKADPITDAALALAEYILDGDFCEVLSAGLGAVYSLLPYKLEFRGRAQSSADSMVLGGGFDQDSYKDPEELGIEDASSPEFRARLDHFLKLLEFIQDVLRRNIIHDLEPDASSLVSAAIVQSILDAVRRIFLENVLYPSILECSDADGSAVAVMSYVEMMVRTLEDGQLADMLVNFLTSEDNDDVKVRQRHHSMVNLGDSAPPPPQADRHQKLHRRKSSAMLLLEMEAPESNKQTEYFTSMARFTMKDLLSTNLKSSSAPTATAALRLFRCLLQRQPQLSVDRLLIVIPDPHATAFPHPALLPGIQAFKPTQDEDDDDDEFVYPGADVDRDTLSSTSTSLFQQPTTTYATHEREMSLYLALVSRVDPSHNTDAFSTGFDHYLNDALLTIQSQSAYLLDSDFDLGADVTGALRAKYKHRLNANDPLLSIVLNSLRNFFANTPEQNVALTGLLATLAIHPDRSLAGWLTFGPADDESWQQETHRTELAVPDDGDGDDRSVDFLIEEKLSTDPLPASRLDDSTRPVVHTILHSLVAQLERYRQTIAGFDTFLLERRRGLIFSENLTDALSLVIDVNQDTVFQPQLLSQRETEARPTTPERPKAKSKSSFMPSFLTPSKKTPQRRTSSQPTNTPDHLSKENYKTVSASPFGAHYQKTEAIVVEPFVAPGVGGEVFPPRQAVNNWAMDEDDVFSSGWTGKTEEPKKQDEELVGKMEVTLSHLLDNVVILEESIKELAAIVQIRRGLAIDGVRYL